MSDACYHSLLLFVPSVPLCGWFLSWVFRYKSMNNYKKMFLWKRKNYIYKYNYTMYILNVLTNFRLLMYLSEIKSHKKTKKIVITQLF